MLKYWFCIPAVVAQLAVSNVTEAADFNGDGRQDIVWRNHDGNAVTWQMNGPAVASRYTLSPALDAASSIGGSGNFFGGGPGGILRLDSSRRLSIWRVNGGVVQQSCVAASAIDASWKFLGIGDLNADGVDMARAVRAA